MKMISAMTNTTDTKVKKVKTPKRTQDFKAVQLKLNEDSVAPHTIYLKEHVVREHTADKPQGRTLLVVNVPPYADEKGITNAFREAGTVQSVQLCLKPSTAEVKLIKKFLPDPSITTFKAAYIVFKKVAELDKALKLTELLPMNSEDHQITTGIKKWIEEYNNAIVLPKVLKENVETFMKQFDETTKKADKKEKELEQEDDEGWVTVTKRGKVQSFARSEKVENKIMQKEEKNKKRKELKNFYTFQIRESKMKHIVSLRQKFEEDKRKIAVVSSQHKNKEVQSITKNKILFFYLQCRFYLLNGKCKYCILYLCIQSFDQPISLPNSYAIFAPTIDNKKVNNKNESLFNIVDKSFYINLMRYIRVILHLQHNRFQI